MNRTLWLSKAGARLAIIVVALCLVGVAYASAQNRAVDFRALDQLVAEELRERIIPGAALAIVSGDRVVYAKGYGVASIETDQPVTPDMLFRMGSTTKMFTAAALVTLAEQGRFKLTTPLGEYVKGLHPSLARLTAHQLLSQSAGLRDFASPVNSHDDAALGQNIRSWKEDVFFTEPGQIYSYSSPGYWMAGFVAEAIHGKPYADTLDELLFKPLGMTRTTLRPLVAVTYPLAQGHQLENGKPSVIRPLYNNVAMWPGGSIFSSANELARFVIAMLNDGKLDGKQALATRVITTLPARQITLPDASDAWYGYGLLSYPTRGVRVVTHGGASRGYGSTIEMVPAHRFGVIVLTNKSGETLPRTRLKAQELALPLEAEKTDSPAITPLSAAEIKAFAGVYMHHPQTWELFAKDGQLYLRYEKAEFPLKKIGERTFSYSQGELVLVAGADGKIEHLFTGLYAAKKIPGRG